MNVYYYVYHVVYPPRCMFTYLIETNTILFDYCAKNENHICIINEMGYGVSQNTSGCCSAY